MELFSTRFERLSLLLLSPGEGEERQGGDGKEGKGIKGKVIGRERRRGVGRGRDKEGKRTVSVLRVSQPVMRRRQRRSGWRSGSGAFLLVPRALPPPPPRAGIRHWKSLSRITGALASDRQD
jgi:hypothetical protein